MSSKLTFGGVFSALFSQPVDTLKILMVLSLGEIGRWLYGGSKGTLREKVGDLIICLLIFYLVKPHLVNLPPVNGIKISAGAVAIVISLLGAQGISKIFFFAVKKKTGLDLEKRE